MTAKKLPPAELVAIRQTALEIAADIVEAPSVVAYAKVFAHFLEHGDYPPEVLNASENAVADGAVVVPLRRQ